MEIRKIFHTLILVVLLNCSAWAQMENGILVPKKYEPVMLNQIEFLQNKDGIIYGMNTKVANLGMEFFAYGPEFGKQNDLSGGFGGTLLANGNLNLYADFYKVGVLKVTNREIWSVAVGMVETRGATFLSVADPQARSGQLNFETIGKIGAMMPTGTGLFFKGSSLRPLQSFEQVGGVWNSAGNNAPNLLLNESLVHRQVNFFKDHYIPETVVNTINDIQKLSGRGASLPLEVTPASIAEFYVKTDPFKSGGPALQSFRVNLPFEQKQHFQIQKQNGEMGIQKPAQSAYLPETDQPVIYNDRPSAGSRVYDGDSLSLPEKGNELYAQYLWVERKQIFQQTSRGGIAPVDSATLFRVGDQFVLHHSNLKDAEESLEKVNFSQIKSEEGKNVLLNSGIIEAIRVVKLQNVETEKIHPDFLVNAGAAFKESYKALKDAIPNLERHSFSNLISPQWVEALRAQSTKMDRLSTQTTFLSNNLESIKFLASETLFYSAFPGLLRGYSAKSEILPQIKEKSNQVFKSLEILPEVSLDFSNLSQNFFQKHFSSTRRHTELIRETIGNAPLAEKTALEIVTIPHFVKSGSLYPFGRLMELVPIAGSVYSGSGKIVSNVLDVESRELNLDHKAMFKIGFESVLSGSIDTLFSPAKRTFHGTIQSGSALIGADVIYEDLRLRYKSEPAIANSAEFSILLAGGKGNQTWKKAILRQTVKTSLREATSHLNKNR